jgi:hypothetical protein
MEKIIEAILDKIPIEIKHKKEIKLFSLGKAIDLPKQSDYLCVNRKEFKSHSSVFQFLKSKKLSDFFAHLESNKIPSVYIFWVNSSDPKILTTIHDNYLNFDNKNQKHKVSINTINDKTQTLYVGKSEKNVDGRAICHLDYTGGKYKSLKIKECCGNTEIMVSIISFHIEENDENYKFWKKILPYTVEYFLAKNLTPLIGKHK